MGMGMARQLKVQGFEVTGFDVYGPSLDLWKAEGGKAAESAKEAAAGKQCLVLMVVNSVQAEDILFGKGVAEGAECI